MLAQDINAVIHDNFYCIGLLPEFYDIIRLLLIMFDPDHCNARFVT